MSQVIVIQKQNNFVSEMCEIFPIWFRRHVQIEFASK